MCCEICLEMGGQREREESEYLIITRQTINEKEDEVINDFDA